MTIRFIPVLIRFSCTRNTTRIWQCSACNIAHTLCE